jgi:hypothetical protein
MKYDSNHVPAGSKLNRLRPICNFIPAFLVPTTARETQVDEKVKTYTSGSQVVTLPYAQLTHGLGEAGAGVGFDFKPRSSA